MPAVNAACRGDRSLEKEQPKAVTPHSHTVPIMGTMQTFPIFSPSLLPGGGKAGSCAVISESMRTQCCSPELTATLKSSLMLDGLAAIHSTAGLAGPALSLGSS